jgi:hypothetical protein
MVSEFIFPKFDRRLPGKVGEYALLPNQAIEPENNNFGMFIRTYVLHLTLCHY